MSEETIGAAAGRSDGCEAAAAAPWQSRLSSPAQRLASLLHSSRLADLTITFPRQNKTIRAHRFVLAMTSPVFEAMFYGDQEEKRDLNVFEDSPESFMWLLEYMYCGTTELPSVDLALQVALLANKYQVASLTSLCSQFLLNNLSSDNVVKVYNTATLLEDVHLLLKCSQVVDQFAESLLMSRDIGQLNRKSLTHLLTQPLRMSEIHVFQSIMAWGQSQLAARTEECQNARLREEIKDFLPYIRFLTMTASEFVELVMPSGVFTAEEDMAILMSIEGLDVSLPENCCIIKTKRQ